MQLQEGNPPAAAFSALTASSKLQHLDLNRCMLPAAVWQHVFAAGRQLPQLRYLNIGHVTKASSGAAAAAAPEGSRLVSCCPGLQHLDVQQLQYSAEGLAPLQRLSELHTLRLATNSGEGLEAVSQLTGLQELYLVAGCAAADRLLLQLTQLKQLTSLDFHGPTYVRQNVCQVGGPTLHACHLLSEPVCGCFRFRLLRMVCLI